MKSFETFLKETQTIDSSLKPQDFKLDLQSFKFSQFAKFLYKQVKNSQISNQYKQYLLDLIQYYANKKDLNVVQMINSFKTFKDDTQFKNAVSHDFLESIAPILVKQQINLDAKIEFPTNLNEPHYDFKSTYDNEEHFWQAKCINGRSNTLKFAKNEEEFSQLIQPINNRKVEYSILKSIFTMHANSGLKNVVKILNYTFKNELANLANIDDYSNVENQIAAYLNEKIQQGKLNFNDYFKQYLKNKNISMILATFKTSGLFDPIKIIHADDELTGKLIFRSKSGAGRFERLGFDLKSLK